MARVKLRVQSRTYDTVAERYGVGRENNTHDRKAPGMETHRLTVTLGERDAS